VLATTRSANQGFIAAAKNHVSKAGLLGRGENSRWDRPLRRKPKKAVTAKPKMGTTTTRLRMAPLAAAVRRRTYPYGGNSVSRDDHRCAESGDDDSRDSGRDARPTKPVSQVLSTGHRKKLIGAQRLGLRRGQLLEPSDPQIGLICGVKSGPSLSSK
jgi:hypothetical protein